MLMEVKNQIKVMVLSIKYATMREMLNKVSFLTNVFFMILNNASFILQWIVLYSMKNDVGGYTIKYYDKASDKSELLEIEGKKITVSSEKININVNESYFMVYSDKNLLIKPYNLDALLIDKE